jgi:hypothetical protein
VSSKDKETARQFLQHLPFEEMESFIDYALAEAKKTNYEPQTLGGIRQYFPGYRQSRERHASAKASEAAKLAKERENVTKHAYDRFRRSSADQLFETLPKGERGIIEGLARASSSSGFAATNGSFANTMFDLARARITADRHPDKIQSFEQWTAIRQAA